MRSNPAKAIRIVTIIAFIIVVLCTIILTCQFVKISNMKKTEASLQSQREHLVQEIYNYNTSNSYYNNNRSEFLEDYAREYLVWGENGETWYVKQ